MNTNANKFIGYWTNSKFLIVVFAALAILMITSALLELIQSKKEILFQKIH